MHQFINGSDTAFADLERRARQVCVVFQDEEMPPGSLPSKARVGFEVNPNDGSALLLVERGVVYRGTNQTVQDWLTTGEKRFSSFDQLRLWIREELGACYLPSAWSGALATNRMSSDLLNALRPEDLTDLGAVSLKMPDHTAPLYLDEDRLFRELSIQVRGQDEALRMLAGRVCRHIARHTPRRPLTLFAVGPTGVGKTKAAELLPVALRALNPINSGYSYLRLDMSEYQERHRISQLLGAPQGYIGYGDGAQLVDSLATNPKTVILFDEIEKAHPHILRTLMNAMDAGRLSTAAATTAGREVDCRHALFLFTSNLDVSGILQDLEERDAFGNFAVVDEVCRSRLHAAGISSELVGRIACFLVFRPLTANTRAEIVTLAIARVAEEYGLRVGRIEPSVVVSVLEQIRSVDFGARPYEHLIDDLLGACFANVAATHIHPLVEVYGPPFQCVLLDDSEAA